ncbi:MAG: class I SAM-dependent methyltransferase [Chitinophagaceae bacterium]|nr:class I SAM-dependent methyltransferase [Chitinophagaceae bacterium]
MKVSSNDIYVSGEYFSKHPDWDIADARWKTDVIAGLLQKNEVKPKEVIEVGCGAGENLVELLKKASSIEKLTGYDISPQAIELAAKKATGKTSFFNEDITTKENVHADLMLIIDVVEHVDDYYGFLRKLKQKSNWFVFHIPLDLSCRTIMKPHVLLQQRQSVGHIHYYTKEMVEWALRDTGYEIIDWVYTKPVVDVARAGSFKRLVKKILRNISFAFNKDWSAKKWGGYSMMVLAK